MPTKCHDCGKFSYVIYFTSEWKKLCGECYKKVIHKENKKSKNMEETIESMAKRRLPWD